MSVDKEPFCDNPMCNLHALEFKGQQEHMEFTGEGDGVRSIRRFTWVSDTGHMVHLCERCSTTAAKLIKDITPHDPYAIS